MSKILHLIVCFFFLASGLVIAKQTSHLNESLINNINDKISDATSECNFEDSTKYYFDKTKFFNYTIVDGAKSVQEQTYDEAIGAIRESMTACFITLAKEENIFENIYISDSEQEAIFTYEAIHYLQTKDSRFFKSHSEGKTIFIIIDGAVKIKETHYTGLAFQEIENLE